MVSALQYSHQIAVNQNADGYFNGRLGISVVNGWLLPSSFLILIVFGSIENSIFSGSFGLLMAQSPLRCWEPIGFWNNFLIFLFFWVVKMIPPSIGPSRAYAGVQVNTTILDISATTWHVNRVCYCEVLLCNQGKCVALLNRHLLSNRCWFKF